MECLWLCVSWNSESDSMKATDNMDPAIQAAILARQRSLIDASMEYHQLPPEEKLRLAYRGILCAGDFVIDRTT